ncbi:MAG: tRNA (5-methylaminomethyl-2-thiouridine)(34)-methyltransferase MnmD [Proteobacteria bacterium]|nr:tRNA (5-methylaminomethyl-2-thiouridine)(34)-methyltransferase MnmD [Pseudomonadota bacterium]
MRLSDPEMFIDADGTPRSGRAGDIYFSPDDGPAERKHVFLDGIGAPETFNRPGMRLCELGFGSGLNFLLSWRTWRETAAKDASLDYTAVEGYPLAAGEIARALRRFPMIERELAALVAALPPRVAGWHRVELDAGRVRLTLVYTDVMTALKGLLGSFDAWYLDGFAPSINPEMWAPEVLGLIAKHSAPGARLATFTAAGGVRRSLAAAGFDVKRRKGFAGKRECLAGTFEGAPTTGERKDAGRVAVIGAGIAGGWVTMALARRGSA